MTAAGAGHGRGGPLLREGIVHVWEVRLPDSRGALGGGVLAVLSAEERERANRMGHAGARHRFVFGRACLRSVLGALTGETPTMLEIRLGRHGKPFLAGGPSFSLSHSGHCALVAATRRGRIGVDVERVRPVARMDAIAARRFAASERAWLAAVPAHRREEAFCRIWTRKEACAKALGVGLAAPWRSFSVDLRSDAAAPLAELALDGERAADWTVTELPLGPGLSAAVAVDQPSAGVERHSWPWPGAPNSGSR